MKRSTSNLAAELQSKIARAVNDDEYILVASFDLSSAFDIEKVKLLLKRLKIIGPPTDIIELIRVWLEIVQTMSVLIV
jgi:hypothetical protein